MIYLKPHTKIFISSDGPPGPPPAAPFMAHYDTLINAQQIGGILWIQIPSRKSVKALTPWSLVRVVISLLTFCNAIYWPVQNFLREDLFHLNHATRLSEFIIDTQNGLFMGQFFFTLVFFSLSGSPIARLTRDWQATIEDLHQAGVSLKRIFTYQSRVMTAYLIWVVLGSANIALMSKVVFGVYLSPLRYFFELLGYCNIEFALVGHLAFHCVFYGRCFAAIASSIAYQDSSLRYTKSSTKLLEAFIKIHQRLDAARDFFSPLISIKYLCLCVILIEDIYLVILYLYCRDGSTLMSYQQFVVFAYSLVHFGSFLAFGCLAANYLNTAKENFFVKMQDNAHRPEVSQELERYELQRGRSVTFSGCGYFDLNKRFILTIVGSAITYSVILIQSDNG